ncbi:MAG TPA: hypothetical protein VFO99_17030 [Pyrinomonadaceae bacterium]|nr:hypothetical protein [Pyrinomonadaceae bacterium]
MAKELLVILLNLLMPQLLALLPQNTRIIHETGVRAEFYGMRQSEQ